MTHLRRLGGVLAVTAMVGGFSAGPSAVAGADPSDNPEIRAGDLITPAVVYIDAKISGTVVDTEQQRLNNGAPYEESLRCTGFALSSDGYIGTAGHCVDPDENRKAIVLSAAKQLSGGTVTADDLRRLGANQWTIEGRVAGTGPDQEIMVSGAGQRGEVTPIPARVVTFRPLGQGDVALLKVELNGRLIPSAELALDSQPQVGDEILSVGYPASTEAVTDFSLTPTVKSGTVSAKQTWKTQPLFQVSAAMTKGMSGGPTVDMDGKVIGVNSFMPSNEDQPFNFISPVSGFKELLGQAGVKPELSAADNAYRDGLDNLAQGKFTDAINKFDTTLALSQQYPGALDKRTEAVRLRAERGDASSGPPAWLLVVAGLAVVLVVAGGVAAFLMMRRNREPALAGGMPMPSPQTAAPPKPHRPTPPPSAPSTTAPTAPSPGGSQSNCKNCGFGMDAGVGFCPRCGKPQS